MKNVRLKKFYNRVYQKGERRHYSSIIFSGDKVPPAKREVLAEISWKGKTVLDAGCGTGELAHLIAKKGAKQVLGIDYSKDAIEIAKRAHRHPHLLFDYKDISKVRGKFDVIVSLGTLEHLNKPLAALKKLKAMLNPKGSLIITCPNWTNPRGYILLSLCYLFRAKITLADLHYLTPVELQDWARKLKMRLTWRTIEQEWGHGEKMIRDFRKRLPKILGGKKKQIDDFINWLEGHVVPFERSTKSSGAVGLYHFKKP